MSQTGPKAISANQVIDGLIDALQAAKNIAVGSADDLVDFGQEGVAKLNSKIDEAIDFLQSLKG